MEYPDKTKGLISLEPLHFYPKHEKPSCLFGHLERAGPILSQFPGAASICMIDDQGISRKQRAGFIPYIAILSRSDVVDFIVFETDLNKYLLSWIPLQSNAEEISRQIKKVYNGMLQCRHYIILWYLLRLGILEDTHHIVQPISDRAIKDEISFQGKTLVNILPEIYRDVELIAKTELIDHCSVPIPYENYYYA